MSTFPTAFEDDTLIARVEPDTQGPHFRAELTDRQLVNEVLAGSDDAFEQIFDRYKRSVAHVAARYFRRPEQIEEIIQISFAKAFTELTNFRGQHEVAFGEAVDDVRVDRDLHLSPGQAEVRVVVFGFRDRADPIDEGQRGREIRKLEHPGEMVPIHHLP